MRYDVLASTDRGVTWRRHAGIEAESPSAAIKRVVLGHDEYKRYERWRPCFYVKESGRFIIRDVDGVVTI